MLFTPYFRQLWKSWLNNILYLHSSSRMDLNDLNFVTCHTYRRYFSLGGTGNKNIIKSFLTQAK